MNDRELLELAAKAAGYWNKEYNCYAGPMSWNPLENDGDALRLVVKLGVAFDIAVCVESSRSGSGTENIAFVEKHSDDPYAATRRAIARAAAEIGRNMK